MEKLRVSAAVAVASIGLAAAVAGPAAAQTDLVEANAKVKPDRNLLSDLLGNLLGPANGDDLGGLGGTTDLGGLTGGLTGGDLPIN